MRALLVTDDFVFHKNLEDRLRVEGFLCDSAALFRDARYFLDIRSYQLIIVDWILPDGLAVDAISSLKHCDDSLKCIVISPRSDEDAEIAALRSGADDYLRKECSTDLLMARIYRRIGYGDEDEIVAGKLRVQPRQGRVSYMGSEVALGEWAFQVLLHLLRNANQTISKERLLDAIWPAPELYCPNVEEREVREVREKLDKAYEIKLVETVRNGGYRIGP